MPPRYLDPNCPVCGTPLVLADLLDDPDTDPEEVWNDEWACPKCYDGDGVWIDFEPEEKGELDRRIKEVEEEKVEMIPWETVQKELYESLGLTEDEIKERKKEIEKMAQEMRDGIIPMPKTRRILNFD